METLLYELALAAMLLCLFGLGNWIITKILVESIIFKEVRDLAQKWGVWLREKGHPILGEKLCYFVGCQLCVGVWVGWILAALTPGPFRLLTGINPVLGVILDGLAYKAVGHITLEITAALASYIEVNKARAEGVRKSWEDPTTKSTKGKEVTGRDGNVLQLVPQQDSPQQD